VATNHPFSEWTRTFTDPRLAAAVVDRLTFNAHIIETGTNSYRLRSTRTNRRRRDCHFNGVTGSAL
jgi:DNA replication protein DnaC